MFSSLTACGQERVGEASFDKFLQGISGTLYSIKISVTPSHNLIPMIQHMGVFFVVCLFFWFCVLFFFGGVLLVCFEKRAKGILYNNDNSTCEVFLSHCFFRRSNCFQLS